MPTRWQSNHCLQVLWSYLAHLYLLASCPKLSLIFCPVFLDPRKQQQCSVQYQGHARNSNCILHPLGMLIPVKGDGISSSHRLPFSAGQTQKWTLWTASLTHVNSSSPGHEMRVGSWSQLVSGLFSGTANVDVHSCQMSQKSFPVISRKCSELPNARAKGTGHSDGSLPFAAFSEPATVI